MDWEKCKMLSNEWCNLTQKSSEKVYQFQKNGEIKKNVLVECRMSLAKEVLEIIKTANENNEIEKLREMFPPAHDPFVNQLEKQEQHIGCVVLTKDGKILFRKGKTEERGELYLIDGENISKIEKAKYAGISWDKEFIAIAYDYGIDEYKNDGTKIGTFSLPDYWIDDKWLNSIISITPFNNGEYILVVSLGGIYVLADDDIALIHPRDDEDEDYYEMIHASVSPRDLFIAVGDKDSEHIILDVEEEFEINEVIDCVSEYAHYTQYNKVGSYVIFNSCNMSEGESVIFGADTDEITAVSISFKMTAGASYDEGFIVGTEDGNIISVNPDGSWNWRYYVGSVVTSIDMSEDGKILVVGTTAGNLHLLNLQYDESDINVISIEEQKRWLIWKNEDTIYQW